MARTQFWPGVIEAYRDRLTGHRRDTPVVTLREGGTPLLPAPVLSAANRVRRCTSRSRAPTRPARSRTAG